jgi:peptide-methionine (R)-S-oxide reductase
MIEKIQKSEEEWKKLLSPEQYRVMRLRGTEEPFSCAWQKIDLGEGIFHCAACDLPLFATEEKFESNTGWPSYFNPVNPEHIEEVEDFSQGMIRTEVRCARCQSHLGHVFNEVRPRLRKKIGQPPLASKRYCINSVALNFKPKKN